MSERICRHVFIECATLRNRSPHAYQVRCPDCDLDGPVCRSAFVAIGQFMALNPNVRYVWRGGLKFRDADQYAEHERTYR